MNTNQLNRTATAIIEELKKLDAFAGDTDIRLAYEVAGLVDDDKVVDLSVKVLNDEVVINFKLLADSPADYLRNELVEFSNHINAFGYRFVSQELDGGIDITFSKPMTLKATTQEPGANTNAMQAALQEAGLARDPIGADPLQANAQRREQLDQVESTLNDARATLDGLGMSSDVYRNEPAPAAEAVAPEAPAAVQREWLKDLTPVRAMSDKTKTALGVAGAALIGGAVYFGVQRFGIKLPFMGRNNVPAVTTDTAEQVLDAAQAVAAWFKR